MTEVAANNSSVLRLTVLACQSMPKAGVAFCCLPATTSTPAAQPNLADLAVTLALGGDCLADIAVLRAEPALFGPVASDPVVSRLVTRLASDAPRALKAIRAAWAAARERAWALAGDAAPEQTAARSPSIPAPRS